MKKTLYEYKDKIKQLPLKNQYTKEEILINDFLIEKNKDIEIYYSPHNEYINTNAKIFIVGITPGFHQMNVAISEARKLLEINEDIKYIQYKCKIAGRFNGIIRKNIISMLDEIKLNDTLNLNSCSLLFKEKDYLLHTVSLIPYSVFVRGKNYTGHTPKLIKSEFLMKYVYENFINEFNKLYDVIIIPLGRAVEEIMNNLIEENIIEENQVLKGFPHPSGANANRLVQFEENKEAMIKFIEEKFKR